MRDQDWCENESLFHGSSVEIGVRSFVQLSLHVLGLRLMCARVRPGAAKAESAEPAVFIKENFKNLLAQRGYSCDLGRGCLLGSVLTVCLSLVLFLYTQNSAFAASYGGASWGPNKGGELGVGVLEGPEKCTGEKSCSMIATELKLTGITEDIVAVAAGNRHSLALLKGGKVLAWGSEQFGDLGNGSKEGSFATPKEVSGLSEVTAIAANGTFNLALLKNGTVKAWGSNGEGELGDGTTSKESGEPVAVSGLSEVTAIATGWNFGLALLKNGTVKAWGENYIGELGAEESTEFSDVPVSVSGLSEVTAIAAGAESAYALLKNGTVKAWGLNEGGELGDGTYTGPETCFGTACSRSPVSVSGLSETTAISSSYDDALALTKSGTVKSWGENQEGELGNGTTENSDVPVSVSKLSGVTAVAGGLFQSLALLSNGTVAAWGDNEYGELGIGTYTGPEECGAKHYPCSTTPVGVTGLAGVKGISANGVSLSFGLSTLVPRPSFEEQYGPENPAEKKIQKTCAGKPVNCATGNESLSQTDVAVGGRGLGLGVTRTYNAQAAPGESKPAPFGYGWSALYAAHLVINAPAKLITVVQSNGSTVTFKGTPGTVGEFTRQGWVEATLVLNSEKRYVYTLPTQEVSDFNEEGQLVSESDRNGNTTSLSYSEAGHLETVTDPAGRKLTFAYNGEGEVESVKDPMGHTVKYAYESGNLTSVTLPGESKPNSQFKYDAKHRLTSITDGREGKTTIEYDSSNRVVSETDPAGRTLKFAYAPSQTTITNEATGSVTREIFTSGYEPEVITRAYGTAIATSESFTYDSKGDTLSQTNGDGQTTTYTYNEAGDRTSMTDPDTNETKWTYDSTHDVLTTTTPNGETTTIKRDGHGNMESIERSIVGKTQKTTYKYDEHGDLTEETNPLEEKTKYEYDARGDREAEIDPEGDKRTWKYNEDSQETSEISPRGNVEGAEPAKYTTTTERDARGRPSKITDPLGHHTEYTYDGNGNVEMVTDGNGSKTTYVYDADNERTEVKEPKSTVKTGYDKAGEIISQTDGNSKVTEYKRNLLEEVTEEVDPLTRKTKKKYDAVGNLTEVEDAEGRTTTYKYDPANRLTEIVYSEGTKPTVKYEYDKDGNVTKMVDSTGETTNTYDEADRLTETKDAHGDKVGYEYNLNNQATEITYPNGKKVVRGYDKAGRLEQVKDWLGNTTKFSYSRDSQPTATVFPTETKNEDTYTYNEADQMSEVKMTKEAETLASLAYTRDNDGQLEKTVSKGLPGVETTEYIKDEDKRLTKAGTTSYEYDPANNPTKLGTTTYTYDKADEIEKAGETTYTYNEVGQRTKTKPTGGPETTDEYNQAGVLTGVKRPKEGETAEIKDTYTYDGDGLRATQTISGTTTYMAWDTAEKLPLLLNDGTNSYIYGPAGLPIEQINSSEEPLYLHHDQAGSTRLVISSTGTVEGSYTYDAYGNQTGHTGTVTTPLGYDGQYTSADTGLIYLRARVYDPTTAQFLTVDPRIRITRAPYSYSNDNPVNRADPTGLESSCETPAEKQELEHEQMKAEVEEEQALANELSRELRELRLWLLKMKVARENSEEQHQSESEGEQREHVLERCLGGVAIGGAESWIVKAKAITPMGALTGCAAGIYGPALDSAIQSVLE
ncbi:MAG: RHS repeat-associated core domain-containing protein [Solirubrobacteraceae bacterium]